MRAVPKDWTSNAKGGNHHEQIFRRTRNEIARRRVAGRRVDIIPRSRKRFLSRSRTLNHFGKEATFVKKIFHDSVIAMSMGLFACSMTIGLALVYFVGRFH